MDNITETDEKHEVVDKPIIIYDNYFKFISTDEEPIYFYNFSLSTQSFTSKDST